MSVPDLRTSWRGEGMGVYKGGRLRVQGCGNRVEIELR